MNLKELMKTPAKEPGGDRKKPNMIVIWIIIAAVILLAFSGFSGGEKEKQETNTESHNTSDYIKSQEERLERILKMINGAGAVSVFISIEGGGEKVLARDTSYKVTEDASSKSREEESESHIVMGGRSSEGGPYVVEERVPDISGVLVVAEGAASEKVRLEIYEAVRAVYGISPHRIKVTY